MGDQEEVNAAAAAAPAPVLANAAQMRRIRHSNLTQQQLRLAFGGAGYTMHLWGENSRLLPTTAERATSAALMPYVYILSRGESQLLTSVNHQQASLCIAVANSMTNGIGEQMSVADATARSVRQLWAFLCRVVGTGDEEICRITDDDMSVANRPSSVPTVWPNTRAGLGQLSATPPDDLTPVMASRILEWLYLHIKPDIKKIGTQIFTLGFVSLAKRGAIEAQKLQRIVNEICENTGAHFILNVEDVKVCYTQVMSKIDDGDIEACFNEWVRLIDNSSLRLLLTIQQAKNSGLVILQCIRKAFLLFPDFDWPRVAAFFPSDMANVNTALRTVGDNKYYGFKRDLGDVKSTKYKSVAYVAKGMLAKHGGPDYQTLTSYRGWPLSVARAQELDAMINTYEPATAAAGEQPAILAEIRAAIDLATGLDP